MAHELDGDWHLFIIKDRSGTPVITPDGTFRLKHNAQNQLENSEHIDEAGVRHKVSGSSKPTGGGKFEIEINEEQSAGNPRPYLGRVIENKPPTDPKRKVIGGFTLDPEAIADESFKKSEASEPGQIDGVWVGTQP